MAHFWCRSSHACVSTLAKIRALPSGAQSRAQAPYPVLSPYMEMCFQGLASRYISWWPEQPAVWLPSHGTRLTRPIPELHPTSVCADRQKILVDRAWGACRRSHFINLVDPGRQIGRPCGPPAMSQSFHRMPALRLQCMFGIQEIQVGLQQLVAQG